MVLEAASEVSRIGAVGIVVGPTVLDTEDTASVAAPLLVDTVKLKLPEYPSWVALKAQVLLNPPTTAQVCPLLAVTTYPVMPVLSEGVCQATL
jgi:hypothetical protein